MNAGKGMENWEATLKLCGKKVNLRQSGMAIYSPINNQA